MAKDPVCGMNVVEATAKHSSVHDTKKFYFCCAACKQQFDMNPGKYTK